MNPFTSQLDYIVDLDNLTVDIDTTGTVSGSIVHATSQIDLPGTAGVNYINSAIARVPGLDVNSNYRLPTTSPSDNQIIKYDLATNSLGWEADAGGSASPGGASGDVQYNDGAGGFGAETAFDYNSTTNLLTVDNINASGTVTGVVVDTPTIATNSSTISFGNSLTLPYAFIHNQSKCITIEDLAATDVNKIMGMFDKSVTINSVAVVNAGAATTTTGTIVLADGAGNPMTITGTNPVVFIPQNNATFAAITAGNTLVAGECLTFSVTNTPAPTTDDYTVCIKYTE